MKFLKQNRKYLTEQLKGNISNILRFEIKDLFKADKAQEEIFCQKCSTLLPFKKCLFCGLQNEIHLNDFEKRNFIIQQTNKQQIKSYESMILCIDLSGSMNCSYPTKYKKINKQYVVRAIGYKNYTTISQIISQAQVIKNFKGIEVLYQSGQNIKDIAYTFKEQLLRQKQHKANQKNSQLANQQQQAWEYITRKQIIQVGIAKYIEQIRKQRPTTLLTVVYFNNNIEIPVDNFGDKIIIPGIQDKTIEEMIALGQHYADKIAIQAVSQVGEKLISNMTKTQAEGQTALTPALAFAVGLSKKFKHDLHQIVVVTDGLSNVGFGQTQQELVLQESKNIFKTIAVDYAIPNACVVNVIGFEDCAIGYDVIDQLVSKTGGIPYNISFSTEKNEKIVTSQTIDYFNLEMIQGFTQSTKQFCYDTKIAVRANNPKIKIHCPQQYKKFITLQQNNFVSLEIGIKSINQKFDFSFTIDDDNFEEQYLKFSVVAQYKRKNKKNYCLRQQLISIKKGEQTQAIKDQSATLSKEILKKLQIFKIQEQNFDDYKILQEKINQNAKISENIDQGLLQKFRLKKKYLDEYDKTTDKLTKDKRSMMSRRHETYKRRKQSQDQDEGDGFL